MDDHLMTTCARTARLLVTVAALGAVFAAGACGGAGEPAEMAADTVTGDAPIRTSATAYTFREEGGGYAVDIPITYRNPLDEALHIVNCRGELAPSLEKLEGDDWQQFWTGVQLMCLSPPIVIETGGTLTDTVRIQGALPGQDIAPAFEGEELDGTYRIVLHNVVRASDETAARPEGDIALEHRVSNPFTLRAP